MKSLRTLKYGAVLCLVIIILAAQSHCQEPEFEEIVVQFDVPKLLQKDIFVLYDGRDIYLPVIELFSLLEINVITDFEDLQFSGTFLSPDNKYMINLAKMEARCFGKKTSLESSHFNLTGSELFLRIDIFSSVFRLKFHFDFSQLKVHLPLDRELPAYRKLQRKTAHAKLEKDKVAQRDIQEISYKREHFKGGVTDWVTTVNPLQKSGQYLGLNLGGMFLGGDLTLGGAVNSVNGFGTEPLRYRWHYVFFDNDYIEQAELGEIYTFGALSRSLKGVSLTNRPQTRRKYFQTITVTGHIGENWEIELYVNNRLIDYMRTDANGEYNFLVDINYGTSRVILKMYGPNGEILTKEEFYRVPFNLIPRNNIEYTLAAGVREDRNENKKYAQLNGYYGLFHNLTFGLSTDFPIAVQDGEKTSFAGEITLQPFGTTLLNGIYAPDNEMQFNFSFTKPSVITLNAEYTRLFENEFRNRLNKQNSTVISLSSPLKLWKRYFGLRYRITVDNYPEYRLTNMYYGIKLPVPRFHINYLGLYKISKYSARTEKDISSQLFVSTSFLRWFKPQFKLDFDHSIKKVASYGFYLHKRIFKRGQISLSFERNNLANLNQIMVSFDIFSGFAEFTSRLFSAGDQVSFTQMQKGSIRYDQDAGKVRFVRRNGIGQGSAVIWPFLDDNFNGMRDTGEQLLPELRANIGGTRGRRNTETELFYYDGLRPYDDYTVNIDPYSLDDPTLQPSHESYRVAVSPNTVTTINVPIIMAAEVSGKVERIVDGNPVGVGGTRVILVNEMTGKEIEITTFNDGEFFYLGIVPGMYRAYIDPVQLEKYGYFSEPQELNFQAKTIEGGDRIDDINFLIKPKNSP